MLTSKLFVLLISVSSTAALLLSHIQNLPFLCGILRPNCNTFIISLLLFCRFHNRGRAQTDDEDSMDTTDVTPTPDIDITPEMGENDLLHLILQYHLILDY